MVLRCSIQWDSDDDTAACVEARGSDWADHHGVVSFAGSTEVGELMDSLFTFQIMMAWMESIRAVWKKLGNGFDRVESQNWLINQLYSDKMSN